MLRINLFYCGKDHGLISSENYKVYNSYKVRIHEAGDFHLTGVTSMFIACKFEEIYPVKL